MLCNEEKIEQKIEHESRYRLYVAGILSKIEKVGKDESNINRRCGAWEDFVLIKADSCEEAYNRAIERGKLVEDEFDFFNLRLKWTFLGLTKLVPIHEELNDGARLFTNDFDYKAVKTIQKLIKRKEELEIFSED